MAIAYEPALNGTTLTLSADPCATLGPQSTLTLRCSVTGPDTPSSAKVSAALRFVLPPEAVVTPEDPAAIALDALCSGSTLNIERTVRIHCGVADGCVLRFEAVASDSDGQLYRSNVVTLTVRRRAQLCGTQTFVNIEPTATAHEIGIVAHVYNHGDGAAENITLSIPPPAGTQVADLRTLTTWTIACIAPGELQIFGYTAYISAVDRTRLSVLDAVLADTSGMCVVLAPAHMPLSAEFAAPAMTIERDRRRFHVRVYGTNDGWGCARDVTFAVQWPQGYECSPASLQYNAVCIRPWERLQAFARANVKADGATVVIAAIDAGAKYELEFDLYPGSDAQNGTAVFSLEATDTVKHARADLRWSPPIDIALRLMGEADCAVAAGSPTPMEVEVTNAGQRDLDVNVSVEGARAELRVDGALLGPDGALRIAAGDRIEIRAQLSVPPLLNAQTTAVAFVVHDLTGELARSASVIGVRAYSTSAEMPQWAAFSAATDAGGRDSAVRQLGDSTLTARRVQAELPAIAPAGKAANAASEQPAVHVKLELNGACIERCLQLLEATVPATVAGHVCALRAFLPVQAVGGTTSIQARLQAVCEIYETTLERLALRLRLPGTNAKDPNVYPAIRTVTIALFAAIVTGSDDDTDEGRVEGGASLNVTFTRSEAARRLELLGTAAQDGGLLEWSLALMPRTNTHCEPVGAALSDYVAALRAADPAARGTALEQIDQRRRTLIGTLIDARRTLVLRPRAAKPPPNTARLVTQAR